MFTSVDSANERRMAAERAYAEGLRREGLPLRLTLTPPPSAAALEALHDVGVRERPWGDGKSDAEIEAEVERRVAEWEAERAAEKARSGDSDAQREAEFRERIEAGMLADLRADIKAMDTADLMRELHADPENVHLLAERDERLASGGQKARDDIEFWRLVAAGETPYWREYEVYKARRDFAEATEQARLEAESRAEAAEFEAYKREHPSAYAEAWATDLDSYKAALATEQIEHDAEVEKEIKRLRVRDEAQRRFRQESAPLPPRPAVTSLADVLARPLDPERYAVDRLWPKGGKVLLSAVRKAGKSTAVSDLTRAFADGGKFLGEFNVPEPRRVTILDFELTPAMLQRWLARQGIRNVGNVRVVELVGRARTFDILDDRTRSSWARELAGTDVLILDPLAPLMASLGMDEWKDGGKITAAFDALREEAGIAEGIIVHHEGHAGTHARGDSSLEGWPDALWRLTRESASDPKSFRFFEAQGREVEVDRGLVSLDPTTGHLAFAAEAAKAKQTRQLDLVLDALKSAGKPLRTDEIVALGIPGVSKNTAAGILSHGVDTLRIKVETGAKGVKLYAPEGS